LSGFRVSRDRTDVNDPAPGVVAAGREPWSETAMNKLPTIKADFLEAGSGPVVMLVHSSVSGARMWRRLMDDLKDHFMCAL
jgi:hypothetical protein